MKKIKVLHIITHLQTGGALDNTIQTIKLLNKDKFEVTFASSPYGNWKEKIEKINKIKFKYIKYLRRNINPFYDLLAFFEILLFLGKNNFDIVHTHSSKPGVIGRISAKILGIRIIIHTIHGLSYHQYMPYFKQKILITIETLLSLVTNKIITVSNLNKKKMLDDNITSSEKIINIYSGINFKKFNFNMSKDLIRQKYLISDSKTIIGFIGRLSEQKNPKILVKAFVELLKQNNTIHLLLIGDGPLRLSIEMLIKKYNIEDNVTITGFINNVPEFLNVIDIYVQPSNWEGLGRALTEAMYMKKAIIATNVDGIPEIIKNNITGILIEPKKNRN